MSLEMLYKHIKQANPKERRKQTINNNYKRCVQTSISKKKKNIYTTTSAYYFIVNIGLIQRTASIKRKLCSVVMPLIGLVEYK